VLDAARDEGLTLTAAIDALLRIEVEENQARRLADGCGSRRCPPQQPWTTSTTTPHPAPTGI